MTAPFLSRFGTPITPSAAVVLLGRDALAHLERPIRHNIPGTLWERVEESGANLVTVNGWLAEATGEHTCGGGTAESGYAHEPGCGLEPLYHFGVTE